MFVPALLIGEDGEWIRGGVDVAWVRRVFNDHSQLNTPTQLYVEDARQVQQAQDMSLVDVWVDLLALTPGSLKYIPRAVLGEECEELN